MSKMLAVVFDEESKAFEASRALIDLHREGSITAYAGAVIARDADGSISVKDDVDEGPVGTALGMLTGALVGLIAGPEGMFIGAAMGSMIGVTADLINLGVGTDFVAEVADKLEPGKVAVVAEIQEYWTAPIDTRMEELGGTVIRRNRVDVEDEQIAREIAANKAEWEELKAEHKAASEERKAKLHAKVEAAKTKLAASGDRAKLKLALLKSESEAKAEALKKQAEHAKEEHKAKLEQRKADMKADYARRSAKLKEAWESTKEALAP